MLDGFSYFIAKYFKKGARFGYINFTPLGYASYLSVMLMMLAVPAGKLVSSAGLAHGRFGYTLQLSKCCEELHNCKAGSFASIQVLLSWVCNCEQLLILKSATDLVSAIGHLSFVNSLVQDKVTLE